MKKYIKIKKLDNKILILFVFYNLLIKLFLKKPPKKIIK